MTSSALSSLRSKKLSSAVCRLVRHTSAKRIISACAWVIMIAGLLDRSFVTYSSLRENSSSPGASGMIFSAIFATGLISGNISTALTEL